MRSTSRFTVSILAVALLLVASTVGAGGPAFHILVSQGGGYVYVPFDAAGQPIHLPGGPAEPPRPFVPSPAPPPAPPGALPADVGFLLLEIEPAAASVYVDGRPVGTAEPRADQGRLVALGPGEHRVDAVHPGFAPLATAVVITPRQTHVLRSRLARERPVLPGSGYSVVPIP